MEITSICINRLVSLVGRGWRKSIPSFSLGQTLHLYNIHCPEIWATRCSVTQKHFVIGGTCNCQQYCANTCGRKHSASYAFLFVVLRNLAERSRIYWNIFIWMIVRVFCSFIDNDSAAHTSIWYCSLEWTELRYYIYNNWHRNKFL